MENWLFSEAHQIKASSSSSATSFCPTPQHGLSVFMNSFLGVRPGNASELLPDCQPFLGMR